MNKGIFQCTCANKDFYVTESIVHKAFIDETEENQLAVYKAVGNGIDRIECTNCGKQYKEEHFCSIEFL